MRHATFDDFSIGVPDGWTDASTIVLIGSRDAEFTLNVTVTRDAVASAVSADSFASSQKRLLTEAFRGQGYRVLEEGRVTVGGRPAFQRVQSFRVEDGGPEVTQLQVHVPLGKVVLTITATDLSDRFVHSRGFFAELVGGVRFPANGGEPR